MNSSADPGSNGTGRTVRTRIAPSPTGDPHVGTAYVALVNYCFAKAHGGAFLLRIEDTDRARSTPESERAILESLRWLGLSWDEGPDIGGPYGPYRQSERGAIYARYAQELIDGGHAFKCYCTPARLEELRDQQRAAKVPPRYDGRCIGLSAAEIAAADAAGTPHVVRMKVPGEGVCIVHDLRRGPIEFEWSAVDMQVLVKSDGMPTYHLANVVDDHLMEITHVFRGEEWVSSAPKHVLLYRYLGWEPPVLVHLPLLRNNDANKSKLSKRKNPTSILFFERMGYLPEVLLNFLGILAGITGEHGSEEFGLAHMVRSFKLEHLSLGGPVFDVAKLDWLNGKYVHALGPAGLIERTRGWGFDSARLEAIAALAYERIERLSDLVPLVAFLFAGRLPVTAEQFAGKLETEHVRKALALAMWRFDTEPVFDKATIERVLKQISGELGLKFKDLARPYYVAMTGSPTSVPLFDAMVLLGRDLCRERFRAALDVLGAPTANEQKRWTEIPREPLPA
ncbi:MAG: glutamate--tRNA ligase [Candidatus Velthaea sp.]